MNEIRIKGHWNYDGLFPKYVFSHKRKINISKRSKRYIPKLEGSL